MSEANISDADYENFRQFIRQTSLERLKSCTQSSEGKIEEVEGDFLVLGARMALIMVAGKEMRVIFKAHFSMSGVSAVIDKVFGGRNGGVGEHHVYDFFKEYCNLVAGPIKVVFQSNNIQAGISLPMQAVGLDEVFFPKAQGITCAVDRWNLTVSNASIACSATYEVHAPVSLTAIGDSSRDSGEVELF